MYFYSAITGGFYDRAFHGDGMPADVCEITAEEYEELMAAPGQGRIIVPDENGRPMVSAPPPLSIEQQCVAERAWRDEAMLKAFGARDRHRDEQELYRATTLSPERFVELLGYLQKLRDWPQSSGFPNSNHRPLSPVWFMNQTD